MALTKLKINLPTSSFRTFEEVQGFFKKRNIETELESQNGSECVFVLRSPPVMLTTPDDLAEQVLAGTLSFEQIAEQAKRNRELKAAQDAKDNGGK